MMADQATPPLSQRKAVHHNKYRQNNNVDDEATVNLSNLLHNLDNEGESKDFSPLIEFFRKDYITQTVQNWSYYAQVNNHTKLIELTILLTRTLVSLGFDPNVFEYGGMLINLVLANYTRVLYRCLNNMRASVTIPAIRLMREMVDFNSGQYIEEFTTCFDLSLHSLTKILTVDKKDILSFNPKNQDHKLNMRFEFIRFWLSLISHSTPLLRKDIIMNNSKIMSAWFKQMDKADTPDLMEQTIRTLSVKVVQERAFKRMTKTQILNEFALSKIHASYYSSNNSQVRVANDFFLAYGADPQSSVAFPNNFPWHQELYVDTYTKGVPVTINQKEFRIHNKMLFNALKNFKPWESDIQCSTVLKILDHVPELVPPYCHFLASHGAHDPKMTSYWFGCTMLFGRIINLKIPDSLLNIQTDVPPSLNLVIQVILPAPLTKGSLTKALHHEKMIITQLACQLLVFSFQKLSKVLRLYETKGWGPATAPLRNLFYQSIPDLTTIVGVKNQCYLTAKDNRIIQLSLTLLLRYYSTTFPNFFNITMPSSNIYMDIMRKAEFSGMDLAIIDNFLQFQETNGTHTRWWNAPAGQNSLFTSLLKMASSKNSTNSMVSKIHQLLENMFRGTVTFNRILCSPLWILIYSLQVVSFDAHNKDEGLTKIWKLLDECISRCMKIPYRYVDMSKDYEMISPFLVALCDQWKFIDRGSSFESVAKWILILLRTFAICGESAQGIRILAQKTLTEIPDNYFDSYLTFEHYESKAENLYSDISLKLSDFQGVSFFQHVTIAPYRKFLKLARCPVTELDAVGLIWRLKALVHDETIHFNGTFKEVVDVLLLKLASFSSSNDGFSLIKPVLVENLFPKSGYPIDENLKCYFVVEGLFDIFHESILNNVSFQQFIFDWLLDSIDKLESNDSDLAKFIATLCTSLQVTHATCLLQKYKQIPQDSLEILLERVLNLDQDQKLPYEIFEFAMQVPSSILDELLAKFIDLNRLINFKLETFVPESLEKFPIAFQSFTRSKLFHSSLLFPYLQRIQGTRGAIIAALSLDESVDPQLREFLQKVLDDCYEKLNNRRFSSDILKLFCFHFDMLTEDMRMSTIKYITTEYQDKYNPDVVKFVRLAGQYDDPTIIPWLNKTILHGTRHFSNSTRLSTEFSSFLEELGELVNSMDIWSKVNNSYLRGQLGVILTGTWVKNSPVLQYVIRLLTNGKGKDVQCTSMLQNILNNEDNVFKSEIKDSFLRFTTAVIIFMLFMMDPRQNSTDIIRSKLLEMYCGTISSEDQIILKIIEKIETINSTSWASELSSVDILETGENDDPKEYSSKFIVFEKEGIFITLNKSIIINTVNRFPINRPIVPSNSSWEALNSFYNLNLRYFSNIDGSIYDPGFLMLLSLQNGAGLVTYSADENESMKCKFEVQKYLNSGIFQILLMSLADGGVLQKISLQIIYGMLCFLEEDEQFKYGHIISILLRKIAFTYERTKLENKSFKIASCIWLAISRLSDLLINPGSLLHEKAFRWVLNSPFILSNDLPLLQDLMAPKEIVRDYDNFYRQLAWVLECFDQGVKTNEDLIFMKSRGILEWLSNLKNLPYLNPRLRTMLDSILYKIQRLEDGGSTLLTRFASVSNLELHNLCMQWKSKMITNSTSKNRNGKGLFKNMLVREVSQLNLGELLMGQAEIMGSQKRLRLWSQDDQANVCKRIKL